MKLYLITILFIFLIKTGFCQSPGKLMYGPIPYRELSETIGDTYIMLPLDHNSIDDGYFFIRKASEPDVKLRKEYQGKLLKLISIDDKYNGHFKDSLGVEYIAKIVKRSYDGITPLSDIENARKLLINKTVWLNRPGMQSGDPKGFEKSGFIKMDRFDPVTVIDVQQGPVNNFPEVLILKNKKGEIGFMYVSVSGTNTDLQPDYLFEKSLFTENPKTKYHFTPAVWELVKKGWTEIGMPLDAFILSQGQPTHVNTSRSGGTSHVQLVYGETSPSYYYFVNGKYTSKN